MEHHLLYALSLHRAAVIAHHKGEITDDQAAMVESVILHPVRHSEDGRSANILDETRQKTATMAQDDNSLSEDAKHGIFGLNFNWSAIWTWFVNHLPQILSCIASLVAIFVLL